jgi:Flp pilus assembly protein TadG
MNSDPIAVNRRKRRSGGNTIVEWMLTILPSMAIMTFFFDCTYAIFGWGTVQNAVREGCRYAITFQTMTGLGQDASIKTTVKNNSMGLLADTSLVNVNYFAPTSPNTAIAVGATPAGNVPNNIVEVSVQGYPLSWLFPISGTLANPYRSTGPASINVYSSDILGGFPAGVNSVTR